MSFLRFISILIVTVTTAGCACTDKVCMAPDGSPGLWNDVAILPDMTNSPELKRTPDGFDPPFNYY